MPVCLAKSFAVPSGTPPSGMSRPSRPLTTSLSVPSPPHAITTSVPRSAAWDVSHSPSPASQVTRRSAAGARCRTHDTLWRSSALWARAPCTMYVRCLRTATGGMRAIGRGGAGRFRAQARVYKMPARSPGFHHSGEWDSGYHAPALVAPLVELLAGSPLVLDGTLGGGGHSAALLDAGVGRVIGIDRDPDGLAAASSPPAGGAGGGGGWAPRRE